MCYLGMDKGESSAEDIEKLKKMVPKAYQKYIESKSCFFNPLESIVVKLNLFYSVRQRLSDGEPARNGHYRRGLDND